MTEGHQGLLNGIPVHRPEPPLDAFNFGLADGGGRVLDGIACTVAPPARREFHMADVEWFVVEGRHALFRVAPVGQRAL